MELYDPKNPSIFGSYNFFTLASTVSYNLSRYLRHGDLLLVCNSRYIGRMSFVCNRLFCQTKLINGIIKVKIFSLITLKIFTEKLYARTVVSGSLKTIQQTNAVNASTRRSIKTLLLLEN